MGRNNIFLKTFILSFLIHIIGISLFSIFLPLPMKKKKPIELFFYPMLETKKFSPKDRLNLREIKENIGEEKISPIKEVSSINISSKDVIGEKEYVSQVNLQLDIEKSDFIINIPSFPTLNIQENINENLIEGPAGQRKLIYKEKIEYPLWAQKKGIEGKVKIKFWVNPDGRIFDSEIYISSGNPELDFYAQEIFKKWLFEPINKDEIVWGIITIIFKLK
ncbi:MAG: energy transducer TonB [Candidatus Omnitrophica bacterium]|nr:energy transducer TonB [Candidatus Omnitrophota bacterium]